MSALGIRPAVWAAVGGALFASCALLLAAPGEPPAAPERRPEATSSRRARAVRVSPPPLRSSVPAGLPKDVDLPRRAGRAAHAPALAAASPPRVERPPVDPSIAQALWLEQIAAERAALRLGLTPDGAHTEGAEASGEAQTHALADALLVEFLVQMRDLPEVLPDGTLRADVEPHVRNIAQASVANAGPGEKLKLLQWAQSQLDR